jgi:(5-formylfuran-3-yl)methyl phosphate synthase
MGLVDGKNCSVLSREYNMTKLLISVKNLEESRIARYTGADVIDLKDPSVGALGALDIDIVNQIVMDVNGSVTLSATVGERHQTIDALVDDIMQYANLGIDVVKIVVSELFKQTDFFTRLKQITAQGIKVVVIFFANEKVDFDLITRLKEVGVYGVMLDTQLKKLTLLELQSMDMLKAFILFCEKQGLVSGLAGSLNKTHINVLRLLKPSFIGVRGGVCLQRNRDSVLVSDEVLEIKNLLLNYNSN